MGRRPAEGLKGQGESYVRRHEKASTAGSTQRQATGLGRFFRGAGVGRGSSLDSKGSGAPAVRRLILPVGVLASLIALLVFAIPASATKVHIFKETFGSAATPSFTTARGIAVDQSTGDVLVMDAGGSPSIKRFNPDGTAANFSALGTNVIDGQGGADLTPQNGLGFAGASESQIAVDNSGTATDGNIYVTQGSPNLINIFASTGAYLGQLTESSAGPFSEACGVAVDPAGAVYVGDYSGGIHKFVPAANPPVKADNTANFSTVTNPCTLAAGAGTTAGFIFPAKFSGAVSKLDSSTGEVKYTVASGNNTTETVDPGTGHVYAASGSTITEFDASGAGSATSVSSFTFASDVRGMAVRGLTGNVYGSRNGGANLEVFGPLVAIPTVVTTAASAVAPKSATLNATVNPDGVGLEECKFEYGETASYGQTIPCAQSLGAIGSGTGNVAVSASIGGLQVGTVYHYRLVAKNENGLVNGGDKTLQTTGPVLADVWTSSVVRTEATLKAKINPEGNATTYRIEWGPTAAYGSSTAELNVGGNKALHTVSTTFTGLNPDSTYHWRIVVTNAVAVNEGPDLAFTTYPTVSLDTSCPNQAFRIGPAASLPDCRGYEMVSPIDKNGGDITTKCNYNCNLTAHNQASLDGGKVTYSSYKSFGDAVSSNYSNQYIATRNGAGWATHAISPPRPEGGIYPEYSPLYDIDVQFKAFTDDLSAAWLYDDGLQPLTPDALTNSINIYQRDNQSGGYSALTTTVPTSVNEDPRNLGVPEFEGYSASGSHAVFSAEAALTGDAAPGTKRQLYDSSGGQLHLVSVLPNGTANPNPSLAGGPEGTRNAHERTGTLYHAVSDDGARIYWTATPSTGAGRIYVRENPGEPQSALNGSGECTEPTRACTIPVSESVPGGAEASFWTASTDGEKALFSTFSSEASLKASEASLYEFDLASQSATLLSEKVSGVLGASDDLSYVYFYSKEALAPGATKGESNLYLSQGGLLTFVATTANGSERAPIRRAVRITPDGRNIAFETARRQPGYDNTDGITGKLDIEVYTYDADSETLTCVSCNPSGARPIGGLRHNPYTVPGTIPYNSNTAPAAAYLSTAENQVYSPRDLSDDGSRLFFNSYDPLLPGDNNGELDVYQWEAQGAGTCGDPGGCLGLISSGAGSYKSEFIDASADGSDVFFETDCSLVAEDPGLVDIYDARIEGGFKPPSADLACVGDACQPAPEAPRFASPASANFRGAGNPSGSPAGDCSGSARRAAKLNRLSRELRRKARTAQDSGQKERLKRRSVQLADKAKDLAQHARRCRHTRGGAGR